MVRSFSNLTVFLGVLLTQTVTAQLGKVQTHAVHPQDIYHELKQAEAALSKQSFDWKEIEAALTTFSNPRVVLQDVRVGPNISDTCSNQVTDLWKAITDGGPSNAWSTAMLDAWGKPEAGLTKLNLAWLGNFDECVNVNSTSGFTGKYCSIGASLGAATVSFGLSTGLTIGGCFPSGCSEVDIEKMLSAIPSNYTKDMTVGCQETDRPYSTGAIITILLYCIMGAICIAGTIYDYAFIISAPSAEEKMKEPVENGFAINTDLRTSDTAVLVQPSAKKVEHKPSAIGEFLMCFSLYTNGYKLLSTKQPAGTLTCLHGIRFISMTWVILGHTLVFSILSMKNVLTILTWMKRWTFLAVTNATVSVDSFFVLSALLTSYLFLKDLEKRKPGVLKFLISVPIMYLHRYIRLTPAYAFMILFYTCLSLYLYNGPLKPVHTDVADVHCKTNWWGALLYVNNVIETKEMCASWGWYLSNDFQFFLVTPFVVYLMYLIPVAGFTVGIVMVVASANAATGVSAAYDFGVSLGGARDPNNAPADAQAMYMDKYYFAPWTRYQSFGVGVLFGFLLWRFQGKIRIPMAVNLSLWAASAAVMLAVLYGTHDLVTGERLATPAEAAIYNGWSRTAWSMGLGYVILACCMGHGGWVNEFLSWPGFIPLSRMTYCAYLVHPVIITISSASHLNKVMWNDITLIYMFAAYVSLSYAVAFLFSIMFEAPFMLLDKKYITGKLSKSVK